MAAEGPTRFAARLVDALRATFLRPPRSRHAGIGAGGFVAALVVYLATEAASAWFLSAPPRTVVGFGIVSVLADSLLTLVAAWLLARIVRRDGITWDVATIALLATAFTAVLVNWPLQAAAAHVYAGGHVLAALALEWLVRAWWLFVLIALARALSPKPLARALFAAVVAFVVSAVPWWWLPDAPMIVQDRAALVAQAAAEAAAEGNVPVDEGEVAEAFDAEAVMYDQPRLLDAAIAALEPRRAGRPNLFGIAFAGDGSEDVFRNEAEYVERLFAQRFDAAGRMLVLQNHPDTVATRPLATWTNLQRAIGAVAERMDPADDILFVYLTSHGSAEHELYVNLDPLPLNAITPEDLAEALRAAPAVRWKVIVVNACYAGGFIDALADDSTLVMAAARSDRTSFGCGSESEITFFGQALLADALNATTSFVEAFEKARAAVAEREKSEAIEPPSEPQIATSRRIEAHLETWRRALDAGEPVPFAPAEPSPTP